MTSATQQPTVLVGVTGCVAAYKACEIVRSLQKGGARVKVVMTNNATRFVGPATFKALTRESVATTLFDAPGDPIHHISLAQEADVLLIAPATANILTKLASGIADDLLSTTALATEAPLIIAPAMNMHMWRNEAVQQALETLRARGVIIVKPETGELACGDVGEGRLAGLTSIVDCTLGELARSHDLMGRRLLVTAGPTYEPLDPVRYLSSRSSGLTGYAIAQEAARRGASVTLVSGPTTLPDPFGVDVIRIETAAEMLESARDAFTHADAAVFSAAVSDFRPEHCVHSKIKKERDAEYDGTLELCLMPNPDILATLADWKGATYVVGFAAETENVIAGARKKLIAKSADLIVANDVSDPSLGFGTSKNKVWLIDVDAVEELDIMDKNAIARVLIDKVAAQIADKPLPS